MILRHDREIASPGLDMTPVIDMVFLLLTFFLAATTFHQTEREMQVALPEARAAGPISAAMREIVINVTSDGRAIVSGRALDDGQLEMLVRNAVTANPGQKVCVRGDRAAAYAHVVRVLDACRRAGLAEPYLEVMPIS